mmetsp:Transcript_77491/g.250830  ORF Transcript_77491/g.250830 Transcript_77491/m.250830 type:complete len:142 (+) Transcript_77491:1353-1778(+)
MKMMTSRQRPMIHLATSFGLQALMLTRLAGTDDSIVAIPSVVVNLTPKQIAGTTYSSSTMGIHTLGATSCMHRMLKAVAVNMSAARKSLRLFSWTKDTDACPASFLAPREVGLEALSILAESLLLPALARQPAPMQAQMAT